MLVCLLQMWSHPIFLLGAVLLVNETLLTNGVVRGLGGACVVWHTLVISVELIEVKRRIMRVLLTIVVIWSLSVLSY